MLFIVIGNKYINTLKVMSIIKYMRFFTVVGLLFLTSNYACIKLPKLTKEKLENARDFFYEYGSHIHLPELYPCYQTFNDYLMDLSETSPFRDYDNKLVWKHCDMLMYEYYITSFEENIISNCNNKNMFITEEEVNQYQKKWANAIKSISNEYLNNGDYILVAKKSAEELYGYGIHEPILFKPTKATNNPFRPSLSDAMSYFVGAINYPNSEKFENEDAGFAINGGKGWNNITFDNHNISLNENIAIAMGTYNFTCATSGNVTIAQYTFAYKRSYDDKLRIILHHSSVPYSE